MLDLCSTFLHRHLKLNQSEDHMSFVTVELSMNLSGSKGKDGADAAKCKTGGSYICSGPTRGCQVPMQAQAQAPERWSCIGTSYKDGALQSSSTQSATPPELVALRASLNKLLADFSKK